jgi:hypothetical protein
MRMELRPLNLSRVLTSSNEVASDPNLRSKFQLHSTKYTCGAQSILRQDSSEPRTETFLQVHVCPTLRFNSLTSKLNPTAQRCLTRFFTGDFASWTVYFVNICMKNQQMQQLFIQFINYVWYLLHVSALHCPPQGAFLVPSERCSIEE